MAQPPRAQNGTNDGVISYGRASSGAAGRSAKGVPRRDVDSNPLVQVSDDTAKVVAATVKELEPGATDPLNRISQRLDLTQPIPEMQGAGAPVRLACTRLEANEGVGDRASEHPRHGRHPGASRSHARVPKALRNYGV